MKPIQPKDLDIIIATINKNGSEKAKKAMNSVMDAIADEIIQQEIVNAKNRQR